MSRRLYYLDVSTRKAAYVSAPEGDDADQRALGVWLRQALAMQAPCPLPPPWAPLASAALQVHSGGLVAHVYDANRPVCLIGVVARSRQSRPLWQRLMADAPMLAQVRAPEAPWCVAWTVSEDAQASRQLARFGPSLAWAWLHLPRPVL